MRDRVPSGFHDVHYVRMHTSRMFNVKLVGLDRRTRSKRFVLGYVFGKI